MHLEDSLVEVIASCSSSKMFNTLCASLLTLQTVTETWRHAQSRGGGGGTSDGLSFDRGGVGARKDSNIPKRFTRRKPE